MKLARASCCISIECSSPLSLEKPIPLLNATAQPTPPPATPKNPLPAPPPATPPTPLYFHDIPYVLPRAPLNRRGRCSFFAGSSNLSGI